VSLATATRFRKGQRVTCVRGTATKIRGIGIVDCGGLKLEEGYTYVIAAVDGFGDVALEDAPGQYFYADRFEPVS
jgi:hypothetical protein